MKNTIIFFLILLLSIGSQFSKVVQANNNGSFVKTDTSFQSLLLEKVESKLSENPNANEITILFAYTKRAALDIGGGAPAIKKQVDYGLNLLNTSLRNSRIAYQAKAIAQFVEVDMDEIAPDGRALLNELDKEDGKFCQVHKFRKEKQADIVCLIFEGEFIGVAQLNGDMMVCNFRTFGDSYVFAHEFGHNLGAVHSNGNKEMGPSYSRKHHIKYRGKWYGTVSNNGRIAIPYFSDDRTIDYEFEYQNKNDNYKWKTERKTIRIGDIHYNNVEKINVQAPKTIMFGEKLGSLPSCSGGYTARLVDPSTQPTPPGAKAAFTFLDFTYDENSYKAIFTYEASKIYAKDNKYQIRVKDPFGEDVMGYFGLFGGLRSGYPAEKGYL